MPKTLLIYRHANAEWVVGLPDHDRPLTGVGMEEARQMGEWWGKHKPLPDVIFTSTATRAQKTAELFAQAADYHGVIQAFSELYESNIPSACHIIQQYGDAAEVVMIVGHNPTWEAWVHQLCGGKRMTMGTGVLAEITLPLATWHLFSAEEMGELIALYNPAKLPSLPQTERASPKQATKAND